MIPRHKPLSRSTKPISRRKRKTVDDPACRAWIHTQPSIVSVQQAECLPGGTDIYNHVWPRRGIEGHHHKPGDDRSMVPLYWWLHRDTKISVYGGGGRRRFAERFGIDWDREIERLNRLFEEQRGSK